MSRIGLEIDASSADLQAALTKSAASLKDLAKVIVQTTDSSVKAGAAAIKSNEAVAGSYADTAKVAKASAGGIVESSAAVATASEASATKTVAATTKIAGGFGAAHSQITKMGRDITVAFAAISASAVYEAAKFQHATGEIQANAGITAKAASNIGKAFLATSGHSIFSGQEITTAFAAVAAQLKLTEGRALTATQSMKVMQAAMNLAEGTGQTLADSTNALANVMQAYHLSVGQASTASDILFNASTKLNVPVSTVATSIDRLHARLGDLAPSLTDVTGLMVAFAQQGQTGSRGTLLASSALEKLTGSSTKVTAVLKDLDVNVFDPVTGKFVGLTNVIGQLNTAFIGLTPQQKTYVEQTLFGAGAAKLMGQVVQDGIPAFQNATAAAGKLGTAHQAEQIHAKTLEDQWLTLIATLKNWATEIGTALIPALESMIKWVSDATTWLGKHKDAATALAIVIGGALSLAVTSFAVSKMKLFITAVSDGLGILKSLAGFIPTVISKIGAMAAATTTADGTIIAENEAAGASFTAMLGPIGAVALAAAGVYVGIKALQKTASTPLQELGVPVFSGETKAQITAAVKNEGLAARALPGYLAQIGQLPFKNGVYTGPSTDKNGNPIQSTPYGTYTAAGALTAAQWAAAAKKGLGTTTPGQATGQVPVGVAGNTGTGGNPEVTRWASLAQAAGAKYGISPALLLADIQQESDGRPLANSGSAQGLTQFTPSTAASYGVKFGTSPADVQSQVYGQAALLRSGISQYGSITAALEDYYGGPKGVANPNEYAGPNQPTPAQYAASVMGLQANYASYAAGTGAPSGSGGNAAIQALINPATAGPKAPGTSEHYDWQTGTYQQMTAAQYKALQQAWYAGHPSTPMPTSPAAAKAVTAVTLNVATGTNALLGHSTAFTGAGLSVSNTAATAAKAAAALLVSDQKGGQGVLGGLKDAVNSGSLSQLNTVLNATHKAALDKMVTMLDATHDKNLKELGANIVKEYHVALADQTQLAAVAAATASVAAYSKRSTDLGTLYGAGVSLGYNTPLQAALAQETPITGGMSQGALGQQLPGVIAGLESGTLNNATAAKIFGGNTSALGTDFTQLASGKLNAAQTASTYDSIYSLIGSLGSLQSTIDQNTTATEDNTSTMVNLLQQQNTMLSEKVALGAAQTSVLRGMIPQIPHFAKGGPVLQDGLIYAHQGEYVVPNSGSSPVSGGAAVHLHQTIGGDMAPLLTLIDSRVSHPQNVLRVSQQIGRRTGQLSNIPGGFRNTR